MRNKLIILGILILGVVVVLLLVLQKSISQGLDLKTSPADSTITINGKKYEQGFTTLEPGTYTVRVTHDLFLPEKRTIEVKARDVTQLTMLLTADGDKGRAWLVAHPDEVAFREEVGSQVANEIINAQVTNLPVIKDLPHADNYYTVNYGPSQQDPEDKTKVALYIRYYSAQGVEDAKNWLTYKGVPLDTAELIYIDGAAAEE